jgi:hypothetical protein
MTAADEVTAMKGRLEKVPSLITLGGVDALTEATTILVTETARLYPFAREVLGLAASWDYPLPPAIPLRHTVRGECADAIIALAEQHLGGLA